MRPKLQTPVLSQKRKTGCQRLTVKEGTCFARGSVQEAVENPSLRLELQITTRDLLGDSSGRSLRLSGLLELHKTTAEDS
ncbi:hypothetical protein LEMLEM_LOCUS23004 [Lemmus lemmus]